MPKEEGGRCPILGNPCRRGRQRQNHDLVLIVFTAMDNAVTRAARITKDVLQGDPVLGSDAQVGTDKVLYLIQESPCGTSARHCRSPCPSQF